MGRPRQRVSEEERLLVSRFATAQIERCRKAVAAARYPFECQSAVASLRSAELLLERVQRGHVTPGDVRRATPCETVIIERYERGAEWKSGDEYPENWGAVGVSGGLPSLGKRR